MEAEENNRKAENIWIEQEEPFCVSAYKLNLNMQNSQNTLASESLLNLSPAEIIEILIAGES
ncbi:MAG: hypothetical protein ABI863_00865 [Ginsengibacter sp.]